MSVEVNLTFKHEFRPHDCSKQPGTPGFTDVGTQSPGQGMTKTTSSNTVIFNTLPTWAAAAGTKEDHRQRCVRYQINPA